jgi:hypothetical protein
MQTADKRFVLLSWFVKFKDMHQAKKVGKVFLDL